MKTLKPETKQKAANMMKQKPQSFESCLETICKQEDCTVFHRENELGSMEVTRHKLFPGIELLYKDIHVSRYDFQPMCPYRNILEIEHCREGRMECESEQTFYYVSRGDICIRSTDLSAHQVVFPSGRYCGVTIVIDLERTPRCLNCLLADVNVQPDALRQKFRLPEQDSFILRQLPSIEHIFSELYAVPESIRRGYLKVKVLEVLLFLTGLDIVHDQVLPRRYSQSQVSLAKNVCQYLCDHLKEHITIAELAKQFGTSPTQLKTSFRGVYGTSIQSFAREEKMRRAAVLLRETDRTVMDIAGQFGYANASKFSSTFQSVLGQTPTQYRLEKDDRK